MLPEVVTPPPGPVSRALLARLAAVESPNVTAQQGAICWERAEGCNVWDVDGNRYLDLTAAFAVAALGHRPPNQLQAIAEQSALLVHGMGDVHPSAVKIELLEALARIAPGDLSISILGCNGADAIEAALKTANLRTGKPGVVTFSGGYHGLSYGTLALSGRDDFRAPFARQLSLPVARVPYPDPYRLPPGIADLDQLITDCLAAVAVAMLDLETAGTPCGAVVVEPMQGRGGMIVPPAGFLSGLKDLCSAFGALLIFDEIYTGFGRTGRWFACEHDEVIPDLLCVGKALTGGFPLSACIGTPSAMDAWPVSQGEALHTYTYLGHPLGCAMALAMVRTLEAEDWPGQVAATGAHVAPRLQALATKYAVIGEVRGRGLMWGLDLVADPVSRIPDGTRAHALVAGLLQQGLLTLPCGTAGHVLALSPPFTMSDEEWDWVLVTLDAVLATV